MNDFTLFTELNRGVSAYQTLGAPGHVKVLHKNHTDNCTLSLQIIITSIFNRNVCLSSVAGAC